MSEHIPLRQLPLYRHYKGGLYSLVCIATLESDGSKMMVYKSAETGEHFVRPAREFTEKFEEVKSDV